MSIDSSAQANVTIREPASDGGQHAAGPGSGPVPQDPVPAAPDLEAWKRRANVAAVAQQATRRLVESFVGHAHAAIDEIAKCQSTAIAMEVTQELEYPGWTVDQVAAPAGHAAVAAEPAAEGEGERPVWSRRMPGRDKVAIVGFSTNHRHLAPLDDPTYEIWGMNNAYVHLKRADRWFELHSEDQYGWDLRRPGPHVEWLKKFDGPLYLIEARADMPNSISYPYHEVVACVGPYLTSGPALMLAFAILEGFQHISIYGIDLMTNTEYAAQKPGFEFLLGLAMGREITIEMPRNCDLLKSPIYGRGDLNDDGERHTRQQFEGRLKALAVRKAELKRDLLNAQLTLARLEGAELENRYWIGQTPEGGAQAAMLARMSGAGREIVEAKGAGGIGALTKHPTGDLADDV